MIQKEAFTLVVWLVRVVLDLQRQTEVGSPSAETTAYMLKCEMLLGHQEEALVRFPALLEGQ